MSIPFMLGTMVTPDRDRAPWFGFLIHLVNGWLFAFGYAFAFESWQRATWWAGGGIGLVHGLAALLTVMPLLPGLHPRMASESLSLCLTACVRDGGCKCAPDSFPATASAAARSV